MSDCGPSPRRRNEPDEWLDLFPSEHTDATGPAAGGVSEHGAGIARNDSVGPIARTHCSSDRRNGVQTRKRIPALIVWYSSSVRGVSSLVAATARCARALTIAGQRLLRGYSQRIWWTGVTWSASAARRIVRMGTDLREQFGMTRSALRAGLAIRFHGATRVTASAWRHQSYLLARAAGIRTGEARAGVVHNLLSARRIRRPAHRLDRLPIAALTMGLLIVLLGVTGTLDRSRTRESQESPVAARASAPLVTDAGAVIAAASLDPIAPLPSPVRQFTSSTLSNPIPDVGRRQDQRAIQRVLNRYRDAVSIFDVAGVLRVWPDADARHLQSRFVDGVEQNLEFTRCSISSDGRNASASCAGLVESRFLAGGRAPNVERTQWQFRLSKGGDRWKITRVDTSPP